MPRTSPARAPSRCRTPVSACHAASCQSGGLCSAQPGRGVESSRSWVAEARMAPRSASTASAFTALVPTSRPTRTLTAARLPDDLQLHGRRALLHHLDAAAELLDGELLVDELLHVDD